MMSGDLCLMWKRAIAFMGCEGRSLFDLREKAIAINSDIENKNVLSAHRA